MSTTDDLKAAFAGESQANRRYTAFAKAAEEEGYPQAAKLFRAAAESETVHALNHLQVLGEVGTTADNLRAAIDGETYEFESMYPGFIETAKEEGNNEAALSFRYANAVEQAHARLYKKAVENLSRMEAVDYHVCQVCGNTVEGEAPDTCPICGAPKRKFKHID